MSPASPSDQLHDFLDRAQSEARRLRRKYANLLQARRQPPVEDESPLRPTADLSVGAVFMHAGQLYEVVERGGGFDFARRWRDASGEKFALNAQSVLAKFYPVIEWGEPLPEAARKVQLLDHAGRVVCFTFDSATHADNVAQLEAALAYRSGCRLRVLSPTLSGLHDGACFYRLYAVGEPDAETLRGLDLPGGAEVQRLPAHEGPYFWEWCSAA